jgi:hypothetical protein
MEVTAIRTLNALKAAQLSGLEMVFVIIPA